MSINVGDPHQWTYLNFFLRNPSPLYWVITINSKYQINLHTYAFSCQNLGIFNLGPLNTFSRKFKYFGKFCLLSIVGIVTQKKSLKKSSPTHLIWKSTHHLYPIKYVLYLVFIRIVILMQSFTKLLKHHLLPSILPPFVNVVKNTS